MNGLTITFRQDGDIDGIERLVASQIITAARLATNTAARRARTMISRSIRQKKAFPGGYVNQRLAITQFARGNNLMAIITGRYRPTQLIRFGAKQLTRKGRTVPRRNAGVSVKVNKDSGRRKLPGAFFVALRAGNTEDVNRGIALRIPGKKNSKGNPAFKVLYSSSVHNVFLDVIPEVTPPVQELLQVEFERQLRRQL